MIDIRGVVAAAVAGFEGNQAAMAAELGVTRATVSRWMSGQSIPDEGNCLRLAKITGREPAEVFRLAGRDASLVLTAPELMTHAELTVRVHQWTRRLGRLSTNERAVALCVLDDMVKSLCQHLGRGSAGGQAVDTPDADYRRQEARSEDARPRQALSFPSVAASQTGQDAMSTASTSQRQRSTSPHDRNS